MIITLLMQPGGELLCTLLSIKKTHEILTTAYHAATTWLLVHTTPAQRLGFIEPTATSLLLITVAFRVYHGMKARRVAGLSTSEPSVECSWALGLINHFLSEIAARLLASVF